MTSENRVVIDTSAWIEYLTGGKYAKKVQKYLTECDCFDNSIIVAEAISFAKRKGVDDTILLNAMLSHSKTIPFTHELAVKTGLFHAKIRKEKPSFGMADASIYITAKHIKAKILTKDKHFKNFKEAIMLEN